MYKLSMRQFENKKRPWALDNNKMNTFEQKVD